ncbi:hypothetical protein [Prochlorococcus marinus]|uniref:hypothetical protein n=1 Tax=Prochlorococcus marinus TaxID=1219 RepID=UPI0022B49C27|nr:hypothetical protein [Prochlorococcus marinus]
MTRKNDKREGIPPQYRHFDKAKGKAIDHGSTEDFVTRLEWRYFKYLSDIFSYATWNGENWVKPNIDNFPNPIEQDFPNLIADNLEVRDTLISKKWIFQSTDQYWIEALKYHVYLENGGKDKSLPNPNIHKTEWIENPEAKPIKVLFNNQTGEVSLAPVEEQ